MLYYNIFGAEGVEEDVIEHRLAVADAQCRARGVRLTAGRRMALRVSVGSPASIGRLRNSAQIVRSGTIRRASDGLPMDGLPC